MSVFHTVVDIEGAEQEIRQLRLAVFASVKDGGVNRPVFDPRSLIAPPQPVARWLDSYFVERKVAYAIHANQVPPGHASFSAYARALGARLEEADVLAADLREHGPEFCEAWLHEHWGGHIDSASTSVTVCRARHLVFAVTSYGSAPPDLVMEALAATFRGLKVCWRQDSQLGHLQAA